MRPGVQVQALVVHQHTLFRNLKNEFFSRNLGQNMLNNAYRKKGCKTAAAPGGSASESPLASEGWGLSPDPRVVILTY